MDSGDICTQVRFTRQTGGMKMTDSKLAKELYEECKSNPKTNFLMPMRYFDPQTESKYTINHILVTAVIINQLALGKQSDGYVELSKKTLSTSDREGWQVMKRAMYKLNKKKIISIKEIDGMKYGKILDQELFNQESYRSLALEE